MDRLFNRFAAKTPLDRIFALFVALLVVILAMSFATPPAHAADITITAASVKAGATARKSTALLAATSTAGQVVYKDANGKLALADDNGTAAAKVPVGVLLNGGAVDQTASYVSSGDVTIGATLSPGAAYYLSDTPGGISLFADVASGESAILVGVAKSASVLTVLLHPTGATL